MSLKDHSRIISEKSENFAEVFNACKLLLNKPIGSEIKKYLDSRVGKTPFNFGYFPPNQNLDHLINLIGKDVLINLGLVYDKRVTEFGYECFVPQSVLNYHNLIMPYHNLYGDIIGIVGRTMESKEKRSELSIGKYKNTSIAKSLNLFGLNLAKKNITSKKHVIIVEGQFDCITAHSFGLTNTIALGGAAFSKYHYNLVSRYTKNVYLALDNDDAGNKSSEKIISKYGKLLNVQKFEIPKEYGDIDNFLRSTGKVDLFMF